MTHELLYELVSHFKGVAILEKIFPHNKRKKYADQLLYALVVLFVISFFVSNDHIIRLSGLIALFSSLWLIVQMFEAYYYAHYFDALVYALDPKTASVTTTLEVGLIVLNGKKLGITQSFLHSELGTELLYRLNISDEDVKQHMEKRSSPVVHLPFNIAKVSDAKINFDDVAGALFDFDQDFASFLMSLGVTKDIFVGAARFVENKGISKKKKERWWSRDSLGRIQGVGKHWSYGRTIILDQIGSDISERPDPSASLYMRMYAGEIDTLEGILARRGEANALLIAEYGPQRLSVLSGLQQRIKSGEVLSPLEHKRLIMVSAEAILQKAISSQDVENLIANAMTEAVKVGNVILVIDDLPALIAGAKSLGADVAVCMDPYISSNRLQLIAISDKASYQRLIRPNELLTTKFEEVYLKPLDIDVMMRFVESLIPEVEAHTGLFFTYQSLKAVVTSAERYFAGDSLEDKVNDLINDIVPLKVKQKNPIVMPSDINELVTTRTGVPLGMPTQEEKTKLLSLETEFEKMVIGQSEAIKSISNALRRMRAQVSNSKRPVGSFLFIGSTGVGKTETVKALSRILFGSEERMMRLDMSEYNTHDALNRLIGSGDDNAGTLTSLIREKPYGVLLLDEFEKTDMKVKDLFLQILDEGIFSDWEGKKVNARNLVIVATSNAGSTLVWERSKDGSGGAKKDEVIEHIVSNGILKPELLNRFDAVVLFNPLGENELQKISEIMLNKLKKRLLEQGIDLVISRDLINKVAEKGSDPQFGARPLNRYIQDNVEAYIAQKILDGSIIPGQKANINVQELP